MKVTRTITGKEGYDISEKQADVPQNTVCISSIIFAFISIGVLITLATWSYITTMASSDDSTRADHTKLHSHNHNFTYHKPNGDMDFISKMQSDSLDEGTDAILRNNKPAAKSATQPKIALIHNVTNKMFARTKTVHVVPKVNIDTIDDASIGKRIESFSPDEVHKMKQRLHYRHGKTHVPELGNRRSKNAG